MNSQSSARKWGSLAVLSLAVAIIIIDTTLINVSLRKIVGDLDTTLKSLQWVITGYALTLSAFTITGGRLGDLFGRKKMFMIGATVFASGSIVAATSHSVTQLLIGVSVIEGLGAAMMLPATASLILSNFQGRERAIAFGVWGGVAGAAASIGPLLGGYLTTYYSWRWGYTINVVIVAVLLSMSWLIHESKVEAKRPTIDYVGIVLSVLGLGSIVYGIVESSTYGWIHAKVTSEVFGRTVDLGHYSFVPFAIAFGAALLIMFLLWEAIMEFRHKTPLVSLKLLTNAPFMAGIITVMVVALGQFGSLLSLPVYLQTVQGLDAFHNGLALLPFSLSVLIVAPISGAIGSKLIPPKFLIMLGLLIDAAGMLFLRNSITVTASPHDLILPFMVFGIGFGMAFAQLNNVTLSAVPVTAAGEASGLNNTSRQLGATLGNAILGSILISALISNVSSGIQSSHVIPARLKPALQANVATQAQSLGVQPPGGGTQRLPAPITRELATISNNATTIGVRRALGAGAAVLVLGFVAALWLPQGIDHGHDAKAERETKVQKTAPDPAPDPEPEPEPDSPPTSPNSEPSRPPAAKSRRRPIQL